jgi:hypothetical protein
MSLWSKLRGTAEAVWQIGLAGPLWKNNAAVLEARNAADNAFATVRAIVDATQRLNANATTTVVGATNTNLSFAMAANEVWKVEIEATAQCSGIGGIKYAIGAPAGATIEGWILSSGAAILTLSAHHGDQRAQRDSVAYGSSDAGAGPDSLHNRERSDRRQLRAPDCERHGCADDHGVSRLVPRCPSSCECLGGKT